MVSERNPSVVSPTLIGRDAHLAALIDLLAQATACHSRLVRLAGEAGIGKSRLVAELKAVAAPRAVRILQGRCFEQDRAFPYAPFIDLLRAFCAGRTADELALAFGATASELVKIFPELSAVLPGITPTPALEAEAEKRRLFQALVQFMLHAGSGEQLQPPGGSPLLLIVEDLHWCDATSLDWLLYFARQLEMQRVLVLLTYRADELHPALNQLLAALDRMSLASEILLERLSRAETEALLRAIFHLSESPRAEFLEALYELTEGNPFFIEEVLKSLITAGDLYQVEGEWTRRPLSELRIPRTVQVAVQQRTRHLSAQAHYLLTLAAVAGQRFDVRVLQAASGSSESELVQQIKELLAAQLVSEQTDETFAFRHALTRQAIEAGLLGRERKALHHTVAEALARCYAKSLGAHTGELAQHYEAAEQWAEALQWSTRAGGQAERLFAYGEALSHYSRARACAERLGQSEQIGFTNRAIGRVYHALGEFPQALASYESALQLTAEPAEQAVLQAVIGEIYVSLADERAPAMLYGALSGLNPATHAKVIATAKFCLGRHYDYLGQYMRAIAYLEEARQLSEPLNDAATLRFIYAFLAEALHSLGRFAESMEMSRRCIALGEGKRDWRTLTLGYWYLTDNLMRLGRWQEMAAVASRGRQFAQQASWQIMEVWSTLQCSEVAYLNGHLMIAAQLAHECVALASELQGRRVLVWVNRQLGMIQAALGAEELADEVGNAAVRQSDELTEVKAHVASRLALADLQRQREHWAQALELYEQCASMLADTDNRIVKMELDARLADTYAGLGRLSEAAALVSITLASAQATGARPIEALAFRVQGQILTAQAQYAEARRAFDRAVEICDALGSRLELTQSLYARGALHRLQHDAGSAQSDWTRTCSLCEQMEARALLWHTHAALGALALEQRDEVGAAREFAAARAIVAELAAGMHSESFRADFLRRAASQIPAEALTPSRRALKAEFGGLTERERQIAVMVAQGKSNREIAACLVLSERTVTTHVSNILSKLDFNSRAQIARWAGEKGLAGPDPD